MTDPVPGHGPSCELVTGATGLVGMYRLAWRLERGWPTVALRRKRSRLDRVEVFLRERLGDGFDEAWSSLEWREADLTDVVGLEEAMAGCDRVFHAAGRVSFKSGDGERLKEVNQHGTANVVDAALGCGIRRLFHVSSVAALGRSAEDGGAVHEESDWAEGLGASPYGVSKHAAELEAWRGHAEGLEVIVVNPTIILGDARYEESSGMVYGRVAKGGRFHPTGTNGFVGAEDLLEVVGALDAAADAGQEAVIGERFVVSAEEVPFAEVMGWVAEELGVRAPDLPLSGWMLECGWRLASLWAWLTFSSPVLSKDMARNTAVHHRYDTSKLKGVLPDFRFTSIRDVVNSTCSPARVNRA